MQEIRDNMSKDKEKYELGKMINDLMEKNNYLLDNLKAKYKDEDYILNIL